MAKGVTKKPIAKSLLARDVNRYRGWNKRKRKFFMRLHQNFRLTWEWIYFEYLLLLITIISTEFATRTPVVSRRTMIDSITSPAPNSSKKLTFMYLECEQLLFSKEGAIKIVVLWFIVICFHCILQRDAHFKLVKFFIFITEQ